jgi:tetratricopeptide (TPR) repeat protein
VVNAPTLDTLGFALAGKGNYEAAIANYQMALRNNSEVAIGHYHLAQALKAVGREAEAAMEFEKAYRLDPKLRAQSR